MILKQFNIQVIFRVMLLVASVAALTYLLGNQKYFFNQVILGALVFLQVISLIYFLNKTNRDLKRLLDSIQNNDFSVSFSEGQSANTPTELQSSMTGIIDKFKSVKIEKEVQFQFLTSLVNQLNIGVITLEDDEIRLINPKAEALLNIKGVRNWKIFHEKNKELYEQIEALGDNGRSLIEISNTQAIQTVVAEVITLTADGKQLRIITFEDINSEIEQKEIEAWQRLIRIMTHEIMNSVTPVSSLTETLQKMLVSPSGETKTIDQLTNETINDIRFALGTIHKRSDGLSSFVENYKKLSRVPKPVPKDISLDHFFEGIKTLVKTQLSDSRVDLVINVYPKGLSLRCDPSLLEQVILNLVSNSIHAMEREPRKIDISAYNSVNRTFIEVADNGHGIPPKVLPEIFVPFYSTKIHGSGIGLSLSKQIIRSHRGNIKVKSTSENGTCFQLSFPLMVTDFTM